MTGGVTRRALQALLALLLFAVLAIAAAWLFLRASLPRLDGTLAVTGLGAPVEVTRDAQGTTRLAGRDRGDLAWATGYVHAQDRYFQMDLLRRAGAGELAALLGPSLVDVDRQRRIHRFRARAEATLAALAPEERRFVDRYTEGVNRGLADLGARPFEYALLRQVPQPWQSVDWLLVGYAMYFDLQEDQFSRLLATHALRDLGLTPAQDAVLHPAASRYDAPLDADDVPLQPAPWPDKAPAWFGVAASGAASGAANRTRASIDAPRWLARADDDPVAPPVGSNNGAIAGRRTATGAALVTNDMHLGLRLPGIWYRLTLDLDGPAGKRRLTGVSLPGTPAIVAGSNGRIAWGFTNSYGRYTELVRLAPGAEAGTWRIAASGAPLPVETARETIAVAGGDAVSLDVRTSSLGPLVTRGDTTWAWRWVAHDAGAVDMTLAGLESAETVADALAVGERSGVPAQNMVVGDAAGHIGWTVAGRVPDRPAGAPADALWNRYATEHPRVVDPPSGVLVTANSRQLADPAGAARLGDAGMDLGARARQLREDLRALGPAGVDERALHGALLDDRALYLATWRERALNALATDTAQPGEDAAAAARRIRRAEFARVLQGDATHASVDSAAYTLARAFATGVYRRLFDGADQQLKAIDRTLGVARGNARWPAFALRLLAEQPSGWLPPGARDWHELELQAVDLAIAAVEAERGRSGTALADATWGRVNTARIAHPLAGALPVIGRWLRAPATPQAGDNHMPRVAGPAFGQSERLVVSPGHEDRAILTMPGGASGHPLSPWFLAGHADWAAGRPAPLLPGAPAHTLRLLPSP